MPDSKVNYAVEDVLGFCQSVKAMVNTYKTTMTANGVNPTAMLELMDTAQTTLNTENATQENLKTQLRDQTPVVDAARDTAYAKASNLCDQVITAFGRSSEQAREATNLRKGLRPQKHQAAATPAAQAH